MADSPARIQEVFGLVDREVWLVTAAAGERRGGLAATWVSQSSLDPQDPLVAIGLARNHFTAELVDSAGVFGLHLVAAQQVDLALRLAIGSGRTVDKLAEIPHRVAPSGVPLLTDCLGWLECRVVERHEAADRTFYWAEVVDGGQPQSGLALRERQLLELATPEQRAALKQNMLEDIEIQRPLIAAWRARCRAAQNRG